MPITGSGISLSDLNAILVDYLYLPGRANQTLRPFNSSDIPLTIKGKQFQSQDLFRITDFVDQQIFRIASSGDVILVAPSNLLCEGNDSKFGTIGTSTTLTVGLGTTGSDFSRLRIQSGNTGNTLASLVLRRNTTDVGYFQHDGTNGYLDCSGDLRFRTAISNEVRAALTSSFKFAVGHSSPLAFLDVDPPITGVGGSVLRGGYINVNDQSTSPGLLRDTTGLIVNVIGGNNLTSGTTGTLFGLLFEVSPVTTNSVIINSAAAVYGQMFPSLAAGSTLADGYGIFVNMSIDASFLGVTNTNAIGIGIQLGTGGSITTLLAGISLASNANGDFSVIDAVGIEFGGPSGSGLPAIGDTPGVTNWYGIRIPAVTNPTGAIWGLYISGTMNNAIAGKLRIGSTVAPTVSLDITGAALISSTLGVTGMITVSGGITMGNGQNIILNTSTGTKIGTATNQKLGFFNAIPIVQVGNTTDLGTVLSNLGLRAAGTAYPITTSGAINFTGAITLGGQITISDAINIALNATTGTKIGTATTQKLAFHNATPVVQRAGAAQAAADATAATQVTPWGYATQAQADGIITLLNEIRAVLVEKGLMKGAA